MILKKLTVLLLASLLIFSLFGCGGKSDIQKGLDLSIEQMKKNPDLLKSIKDMPKEQKEKAIKRTIEAFKKAPNVTKADVDYYEKALKKVYGL